jgi:hypothetical protein
VDSITVTVNNGYITVGNGLTDQYATSSLREVVGDFRCPSGGVFFDLGDQGSRTGAVTLNVEKRGSLEVNLEHKISIKCIPD